MRGLNSVAEGVTFKEKPYKSYYKVLLDFGKVSKSQIK